MNDFLPLNRKIMKHWLWEDKPFSKGHAWIDLLMLANYTDKKKPKNGEIITCKRGNVNLSMKQLSDRWGWDRRTVKRFLDLLENDNMVSVDSTTHGTTITIVNYEVFNSSRTTECTTDSTTNAHQIVQPDVQPNVQPIVQQMPTTNKDKNIKNEEEREECKERKKEIEDKPKKKEPTVYYPNDELLNSAFKEFLVMRNKIKKPIATKRALTRMMNKIEKLSGGNNDLAIKILNQSTDHCWQDVYELKEDKQSNTYAKNGDRDILSEWRNS